jgi:hypothetical protein
MRNMFNRLNRYQDDLRGNMQHFRQNWRQEMRDDWRNYRQGYAEQLHPYVRHGRDYLARARDYVGHNMFSDDYDKLKCVRNRRNPYGRHAFATEQYSLPLDAYAGISSLSSVHEYDPRLGSGMTDRLYARIRTRGRF